MAIEIFAYGILPILLIANWICILRDKRQYAAFKLLDASHDRQRILRRWVIESFLFYGLTSLACLFAIGQSATLLRIPGPLGELSDSIRLFASDGGEGGFLGDVVRGMTMAMIPVLLFGHTAVTLLRTYTQHRKQELNDRNAMLEVRDIEALFPRNRQERFWTTLISINAGISEELFFRLLAPLLFYVVTGNAFFSVIAATCWFGLAHYYQGWVGIVITMFLGALFMFLYLYTRSIWLVVLLHAIVDLNDLSFAPWFAEWLESRRIKTR